ncbi:MAG: alpha/beta hydrolase [Vampirovibrionia bacterium]
MNIQLNYPTLKKHTEQSSTPKKQVYFGLNNTQQPQAKDIELSQMINGLLAKIKNTPKDVEFLKFTMPQNYPYDAIKAVFVPVKKVTKMELPGEPAIVKSGNVNLNCWFIPPQQGKPTVLWCHGNGETISSTQVVAKQIAAEGNGVMMVEYEGYGANEGAPSEEKVYNNALDAAKYLNTQKGIPNNQIIVMGHSLGGPIAAHTAASVPEGDHFKAVILDSTVPDMGTLVKSWIDNDYLAKISEPKENYTLNRVQKDLQTNGGLFPTSEFIPHIPKSTKILMVHSYRDNVVDGYVGEKLMDVIKANRPDASAIWEDKAPKSHQDYTCRMPTVLGFISSQSLNRLV